MKHIVISTVFLILSISFFFGILAFAEWNINPYYWDVVTPFEIVPDDGMPYEYCMGKDIEELLKCDGIILCHDWFGSKGCRAECSVAEIYGKQIKIDNTPYDEDKI